MADKKISALTGATTPLAGTEVLPIVQSGATVKVAVSDLTAGRAVATGALTTSGNIRVQYSAAGNVSSIANNTASTAGATSQFIATNDAGRNLRAQYTASGGAGGSALTNGITTETAQIYTDGNYPLVLGTNVSAAAIIDTSQNVKLINNLIIGTSGKGIDFSATPGTGTSELLADYEEGTWTPLMSLDGNGVDNWTSSGATGRYTKIGRLVTVECIYTYTAKQAAGGSFAFMSGLPFTPAQVSGYFYVAINNGGGADTDNYSGIFITNGKVYFNVNQNTSTYLTGNGFPAATRTITFQASYIA
jgi:hypothetical protein